MSLLLFKSFENVLNAIPLDVLVHVLGILKEINFSYMYVDSLAQPFSFGWSVTRELTGSDFISLLKCRLILTSLVSISTAFRPFSTIKVAVTDIFLINKSQKAWNALYKLFDSVKILG